MEKVLLYGSDGKPFATNRSGQALASAARTTTTSSPDFTNPNCRGITVVLDVTVAGTGTLTCYVAQKVNGISRLLGGVAITAATGRKGLQVYPGTQTTNVSEIDVGVSRALGDTFFIYVTHTDGSSWTYSVQYSLIA